MDKTTKKYIIIAIIVIIILLIIIGIILYLKSSGSCSGSGSGSGSGNSANNNNSAKPQQKESYCTLYSSASYPGFDVRNTRTGTANESAIECHKDSNCQFATYVDGTCYLKKGYNDGNYVTKFKIKNGDNTTYRFAKYENITIPGFDLSRIDKNGEGNDIFEERCNDACMDNTECKFYNIESKSCWLKKYANNSNATTIFLDKTQLIPKESINCQPFI